jgi:hypothetical protein
MVEGDKLMTQLTGQPKLPIFAETQGTVPNQCDAQNAQRW